MKATRVRLPIDKEFEDAHDPGSIHRTYEVDPPIIYERWGSDRMLKHEADFVCVDFAYTRDRGPETMVFPCDSRGRVISWSDLWCGRGDHASDGSALRDMGYEVDDLLELGAPGEE